MVEEEGGRGSVCVWGGCSQSDFFWGGGAEPDVTGLDEALNYRA